MNNNFGNEQRTNKPQQIMAIMSADDRQVNTEVEYTAMDDKTHMVCIKTSAGQRLQFVSQLIT